MIIRISANAYRSVVAGRPSGDHLWLKTIRDYACLSATAKVVGRNRSNQDPRQLRSFHFSLSSPSWEKDSALSLNDGTNLKITKPPRHRELVAPRELAT